jgi:hypothetical protein
MRVCKDESVNYQISDKVRKKRSDASPSLESVKAINPFEKDLVIQVVKRDGGYYKDSSGAYHRNSFLSDKRERTNLFMSSDNKDKIVNLSASGMRLFVFIAYTLKPRQDKYWLNTKMFMRESGVTINTMKAGIKELLDKNIIALTDVKGIYFINPAMLFRGNRVDVYEDKVEIIDSRITLEKGEVSNDYSTDNVDTSTEDNFKSSIDNIF